MKHPRSYSSPRLLAVCLGSIYWAACSSADHSAASDATTPASPGAAGTPSVAAAGSSSGSSDTLPEGVDNSGSQATNEGNVNPVGVEPSSGSGGTGSQASAGGPGTGKSGAGNAGPGNAGAGTATGSAGTGAMPNCDVPPDPSPLVGWAAVDGLGVATTTGGGTATPTVVTTLAELQTAVAGTDPGVIHVRGILDAGVVRVGSNKTIIGLCGAEVHGHIEISASVNVIVRNLTVVGFGQGDCTLDPAFDATVGCSSGADAISVQRIAHHIWFDHDAIRDGTDGNLDITNGANFVTVSWTKFSYTPRTDNVGNDSTGAAGHRFSNLVGSTDTPKQFDDANSLNITWHHDWWADNVVERQPRIRFGKNHLFNNYYDSAVANYCVRAGIQAQILLEGNFFEQVDDPHQFNSTADQATANITATTSNVYSQTSGLEATGGGGPAFTSPPYTYVLDDANGVPAAIKSGAGPQ
jgi:pectate lyase